MCQWPRGLCIWSRSWTGSAGGCCRGGGRFRWIRISAWRRCARRWRSTGGPRFSTPTRAFSSPARTFWPGWKPRRCGSVWMGRADILDNIFIERLWRSLKHEEIFLKAYGSPAEARSGIGGWLTFYNDERPHQTHGYRTPREVFNGVAHGHVDNVSTLTTCPQAQQQQEKAFIDSNIKVSIALVTSVRA